MIGASKKENTVVPLGNATDTKEWVGANRGDGLFPGDPCVKLSVKIANVWIFLVNEYHIYVFYMTTNQTFTLLH